MTFSKEKFNGASLLGGENYPGGRKNGNSQNSMRKYQQLALVVLSVFSLVAFLFYKHEYDRLRYTLEYLEMFGSPPLEEGVQNSCGNNVHRMLNTAPPSWTVISEEATVYSAFWDEGNGFTDPVVRVIALLKKSNGFQQKLRAFIYFENTGDSKKETVECSVEKMKDRNHATSTVTDITLAYILCKPQHRSRQVPYMIQFQIGTRETLSNPILIQESESWKSVANVTAACVYTRDFPSKTSNIIEFIAFHNSIGVEKFVFFGPLLTPLARKLLDKYSDEIGIFYEEQTSTIPLHFEISQQQLKLIIENDCMYRHRDTHENVIVLKINQFLIPRTKLSLQGVLGYLPRGNKMTSLISEFHFISHGACLDKEHPKNSDLLLDSQVRLVTSQREDGIALLRPHLVVGGFSSTNEQHIPGSVASVLTYEECSNNGDVHTDYDHLPVNQKFAEQVRKSLLYRKWKVNS